MKEKQTTLLLLCMCLLPLLVNHAETALDFSPNKENVKFVLLQNDSVAYKILIDKAVKLAEIVDKKTGTNLLADNQPLLFASVRNPLWLDDVGFHLFTIDESAQGDQMTVTIKQQSSYVENPIHVTQTFTLGRGPELTWRIHLYNSAVAGRAYRDPLTVTSHITFPVMQSVRLGEQYDMHYMLPTQGSFFCIDDPDDFIFYFTHAHDPKMPIDIYNEKLNAGLYFHILDSKLQFNFADKTDFQSFVFKFRQEPDDRSEVLTCKICPHAGDWHAAFWAFKKYIRSNFDFTFYERPVQKHYRQRLVSHFTYLYGHDIYDPINNRFRINEFLDEGELNFGGYDYMLLWHDYQRMGIDNRNQFDMYSDLPGGLPGVKAMVDAAHARDVQVFIPYKPWDIMNGVADHFAREAEIARATGSDGVFLDTMSESDIAFRRALDAVNPDNVFVSEGRPDLAAAQLVTGSWNQQGNATNKMPNVDLFRFILPEHNVHNINRGARNRQQLILNALFNGTGFIVWEDIFGEINRYTWQERIMIQRYSRIIHENRDAYLTDKPVPLVPDFREDVYVNAFPIATKCVYPVYQLGRDAVDRNIDNRLIGRFMPVDHPDSWHYVDVWNHEAIPTQKYRGVSCLVFPEEPADVMSCILALPSNLEINREDEVLHIVATAPVENASLHINTVDNLTLLEENQLVLSGNSAEIRLTELNLDFPYKVLIKLMQDDILIDQVVLNTGWKNFNVRKIAD